MAYFLDGHGLFKPKLHIGSMDNVKISSLDEKIGTVIQKKYPSQDSVSFAEDVNLYGTQYVNGMILSACQCSDLPEVFEILNILVDFEKVYFVTAKLSSWFLEHYRSYQLIDSCFMDTEILESEALNDYHPLTAYQGQLMVTRKVCLLH